MRARAAGHGDRPGHFTDEVFGRVTREGDNQCWTPVGATPASR
ncbi:hypothetical protein AB0N16_04720 [Streptomyces sp. NPDC051105]